MLARRLANERLGVRNCLRMLGELDLESRIEAAEAALAGWDLQHQVTDRALRAASFGRQEFVDGRQFFQFLPHASNQQFLSSAYLELGLRRPEFLLRVDVDTAAPANPSVG